MTSSDVLIAGNGAESLNGVSTYHFNTMSMSQHNITNVTNLIGANAETGGNTASGNTNGNSTVTSGDAGNSVTTLVTGSFNSL